MATVSQMSPIQRAQNLQQRVHNLGDYGVPQQDLDDFAWIITRALELEEQKQQSLQYQSNWHKDTFAKNPIKYEEHKRKNNERIMKNYHEDPAYREKDSRSTEASICCKKEQLKVILVVRTCHIFLFVLTVS